MSDKIKVSGGGQGTFLVERGEEKLRIDSNQTAYQAAHELASWLNGPDPEPEAAPAAEGEEPAPKKAKAK